MTTEFTKAWLKEPRNQRLLNEAHKMAKLAEETGEKRFHPFYLFQDMACLNIVWSQKDLKEQGWTKGAIKKYLLSDIIFSFEGINVYLAGAVKEAAYSMPNCAAKTRLVIQKLCQ